MPLPQEYYNILNTGAQSGISNFQGSYDQPGIYPGMFFEEEGDDPRGFGSFADLAAGIGKGAVSGVTWSAVDMEEKDWEDMNTMDRTGWIVGEGLSLFLPIGPFGLLGKAGKAATRGLGNNFIKNLAKNAGRLDVKEANSILTGIGNVAKKTGIKPEAIIAGVDKELAKSLRKITKDDLGIGWINQMSIGGAEAANAGMLLRAASTSAVLDGFARQGITNVTKEQAGRISNVFMKGLGEGKYVNDIAEWMERGLGSRLPEPVSKYLGMAAQDMVMMGIHGLGVGAIGEHLRGEEMDATESLSHSAMMSLAFPLIRRIPLGGETNIGQGLKAYWRSYASTDYSKLAAKYGDGTVRSMLSVMTRGGKFDVINHSKLQRSWKVPGRAKEYTMSDIETSLFHADVGKRMPMGHVFSVLDQMKKTVGSELTKGWGKKWLLDVGASSPRMALGVIAMNATVFKTGAFRDMDGPELASHMLMSALMTKGRGAWGRDLQRGYLADMQPYYEALDILGARPDVLQDRIRMYVGKDMQNVTGASFATAPTGRSIEQAFDTMLPNTDRNSPQADFRGGSHKIVKDASNIYNSIKRMKDPEHVKLEPENLDKQTLDSLAEAIKKIEVSDGKTIGEIGWEGTQVKLTERPAQEIVNIYGRMLEQIGTEHGISVSFNPDRQGKKISGELVLNAESEGVITYNTILQRLESLGKAEITQRGNIRGVDSRDLKGGTPEEISTNISRIAEGYMDMMDAEYGGKKMYNNARDNSYLDFIGRASHISTKDFFFKVMHDVPDTEANSLTASMDKLFMVQDHAAGKQQRYLSNISEYNIEKPKNEGDGAKKSAAMLDLEPLFELMKIKRQVAQDPSPQQKEISIENLEIAADKFRKRFSQMPSSYKTDFFTQALGEYAARAAGASPTDRRAILALKAGKERGIFTTRDGKVQMMNNDQVNFIGDPKTESGRADIAKTKENLDIIAGALGPNVERVNYIPVETGDPKFHTITMKDIAYVANEVGNSTIKDLMKNGYNAVKDIQFENDVLQRKVDGIKVQLENAMNMKTGDINSDTLDKIIPQIESLLKLKVEVNDVAELQTQLMEMKNHAQRGDRSEEYYEAVTKDVNSINEVLQKIMKEEVVAKKEVQTVVNKLINLTIKGKNGGGLSRNQAIELVEQTNQDLYKIMNDAGKRKASFSEMITDFNQDGGSWKEAANIIRTLNQQMVGQVLQQSRNPLFRDKALKLWEESYERNQIHHKQSTLQTIGQKYGLLEPGEPNKISKAFIKQLNNPDDPYSVRTAIDGVRDRIYSENSLAEASRMWKDFIEKDSNILISALLNGRVRSQASIKSGLLTFNPDGKFRSTVNDDFADRVHINGHNRDPYKVHFLEDNMVVQGVAKNKVFSIDSYKGGDPLKIQDHINRSIRVSELQPEILERMMKHGYKITQDDVLDLTSIPTSPLVYMRLSPGMRVLFDASQPNIDKMNNDYNNWLIMKEAKIRQFLEADNPGITDRFVELFKPLAGGAETDAGIRLKMLAMHLDHTKTGAFNGWMKEMSIDAPDFSKLAGIESNLYKRGFLTDGGTTQRIQKKLIDWNAENHTDPVVKAFSRELRDKLNNKYKVALVADEAFQDIAFSRDGSPFDNRRVISKQLRDKRDDQFEVTGGVVDQLINRQVFDVEQGRYKSLNSSILDGAKIVDEKLGRLLWAQKGGMGEWNGAKTILFSTGANSLTGKGFAVYIPEVSKALAKMNGGKGVHMLLGESSAKSWDGLNLKGTGLIEPYNMIAKEGVVWTDALKHMGRNNMMDLDISDIGVQFTSKNVEGVHISSSLVDWQSPALVQKTTDWMGIDALVKERGNIKSFIGHGNELIHAVFNAREQEGQVFTEGSMGLIRKLVDYGVSGDNPLVRSQLDKMLRNEDYKMFSKIPNRYGEDNFIVPDVDGRLSTPVFAEIIRKPDYVSKASSPSGELDSRVAVQFGGIGISKHTASVKYGGKNITDKPFVFRDENGIDHVVEWGVLTGEKKSAYHFFSPFYDRWDPYKIDHMMNPDGKEQMFHLGNSTDNLSSEVTLDKKFNKKMETSKKFVKKVSKVLDEVKSLVRDHNLDLGQVHRLLAGAEVSADNGSGGRVNIKIQNTSPDALLALRGAIGASTNAIPKVSKDQPVMRVDQVSESNVMNGTVRVNAYDLRTTLQRDFDGDHLYTYFDMPFEMIKEYSKDMGHKSDYEMFEKSINSKDINIFGLGTNPDGSFKLGTNESDIGFSKYANYVKTSRMAIGSIISARKTMSWLANADLKVMDKDGNYQTFLRDFISKQSLINTDMKVLDRMMDVAQNALDLFGGQNRVMLQDALENYYFFGEMPGGYEAPAASLEMSHSRESVFRNLNFGHGKNRELQRASFKIMLKTLAKANRMSNDMWDEAGSRAPEVWELKKDHSEMKRFFKDPTTFLIGELSRQSGWMQKSSNVHTRDKGKMLRDQMQTEFFSEKGDDIRNIRQINELHDAISKGKARAKTFKKYRFDYKGNKLNLSIGGRVLDQVMKKNIYNDTEGMADLDVSKHSKAGYIVSNLVDKVAISRMFNSEPVRNYKEFTLEEVVPESMENSKAGSIKNSITRGHIRNILQKEHRQLTKSLRWFNEEKFTNPMKLEGIVQRLSNVSDAIKIIDKQVAEEMVLDRPKYSLIKNYGKKAKGGKKISDKMVGATMVYEIKGEVSKKKAVETNRLIDHETAEGIELDYGKLKPYRWVNDGERFKMRKGSTYLLDRMPMMRESASKVEAEYAEAWKQVTGVGRIDARRLTNDEVVGELFRTATSDLRRQIDGSYYDAVGDVKFDRNYGKDIHRHASETEISMIDNYMRDWSKKMTGTEKDPERIGLLMRYLLQPQIMTGKYVSDGNLELPFYKTSKRLQTQVFNWALESGHEAIVKDMITKVEQRYRGERYEEDLNLTGYKRMYKDGYRWEDLGDMANVVKSLTNGWFTSPWLIDIEGTHNLIPRQYMDMRAVKTLGPGDKSGQMMVRQKAPRAYDEKGCTF